jgi:hypothetical protein
MHGMQAQDVTNTQPQPTETQRPTFLRLHSGGTSALQKQVGLRACAVLRHEPAHMECTVGGWVSKEGTCMTQRVCCGSMWGHPGTGQSCMGVSTGHRASSSLARTAIQQPHGSESN